MNNFDSRGWLWELYTCCPLGSPPRSPIGRSTLRPYERGRLRVAEYSTQIAARFALALRAPVRSRALRGCCALCAGPSGSRSVASTLWFCVFCVINYLRNLQIIMLFKNNSNNLLNPNSLLLL